MNATASDLEIALASHLNFRKNLIVPNLSWGLHFGHELDLFVLTPANIGWEIEIKVTRSDLKRDLDKPHAHFDPRIARLYFALPDKLRDAAFELVPEQAGIITVDEDGVCRRVREAQIKSKHRFSLDDRLKVLELMAMRIWSLKRKLSTHNGEI